MDRKGDWMQTFLGERYWPLDPRPEDIHIGDIGRALGKICRFGGHTKQFYSVAEHCVLISKAVPEVCAMWGLLHDATEAYMSDLVRPLKQGLADYKKLESRTMGVIIKKYGLKPSKMPKAVKDADEGILKDEQEQVMGYCEHSWWHRGPKALGVTIECWDPHKAGKEFLERYWEIRINSHARGMR